MLTLTIADQRRSFLVFGGPKTAPDQKYDKLPSR